MDSYQYLVELFESQPERVFYGRQIEVFFEQEHFHWKTNRGLRDLAGSRKIGFEKREIVGKRTISLYWNKSYRYYKREASQIIELVEKFSDPRFAEAIGQQAEYLMTIAFARFGYSLIGTNSNVYNNIEWTETKHDFDLIVEKNGVGYGVEIKNTLSYMNKKELDIKLDISDHLGITPIIVNRAMPKTWIKEVNDRGGFALIMRWLLYPPFFKTTIVKEMREVLDYPVDTPKAIYDGTMNRLEKWIDKR